MLLCYNCHITYNCRVALQDKSLHCCERNKQQCSTAKKIGNVLNSLSEVGKLQGERIVSVSYCNQATEYKKG